MYANLQTRSHYEVARIPTSKQLDALKKDAEARGSGSAVPLHWINDAIAVNSSARHSIIHSAWIADGVDGALTQAILKGQERLDRNREDLLADIERVETSFESGVELVGKFNQ